MFLSSCIHASWHQFRACFDMFILFKRSNVVFKRVHCYLPHQHHPSLGLSLRALTSCICSAICFTVFFLFPCFVCLVLLMRVRMFSSHWLVAKLPLKRWARAARLPMSVQCQCKFCVQPFRLFNSGYEFMTPACAAVQIVLRGRWIYDACLCNRSDFII